MTDSHTMAGQPASAMQRAKALEAALTEKGLPPDGFADEFNTHAEEQWVTRNGAQVVARASTDGAFRERLLKDGKIRRRGDGIRHARASPASGGAGEYAGHP